MADTNLTQAQRLQMRTNLDSALNVLNTFVGCTNTGGRVAATANCDANNIQPIITAMIPQTTEKILFKKTLSFGNLTPQNDISRFWNDQPDPNTPNTAAEIAQRRISNLTYFRRYDEADLQHIFERGRGIPLDGIKNVLSDDSEQRILAAFYGGGGRSVLFNENDAVSIKLDKNPTFRSYFSRFVNRIKPLIDQNNFSAITNDYVLDNIQGSGIGRPNFSDPREILFFDYYGLMGGVQRIEIETTMIEISYNVPTPPYTNNSPSLLSTQRLLKTVFTMRDWFGSDWDDIAPGPEDNKQFSISLKAFFMLQHFRNSYQPFETIIRHRAQLKI